jgi:uroporphyrinogen-III synthase
LKEAQATKPLEGLTIVVTGSRRAGEQSALVSNMGGVPYVVPTVGISLPATDSEVEPFLKALTYPEGVDYAVFMTATGVRTMMLAAERLGVRGLVLDALNNSRTAVVARSGKPRGELVKQGVKVDASPPREEATADGLVKLMIDRGISGKTVAILWHGSRNDQTGSALRAAGARDVIECLTYHYSRGLGADEAGVLGSMGFKFKAPQEEEVLRLIEEIARGSRKIDAVTFTSPPAASNLFEIAAEHGLDEKLLEGLKERRIVVVAVGSSTKEELEGLGVEVQVMPEISAMGAMMNALSSYLAARGR